MPNKRNNDTDKDVSKRTHKNKSGKWSSKKRQSKDKEGSMTSDSYKSGPNNDVSWYVPDQQILNDVARLPYSFPVGVPFIRDGKFEADVQQYGNVSAIPGIAAMRIVPTIGNAKTAGDAVNVAANGMYTFVRHLNSGSRNYDANDLIIYCMAVDAAYYTVAWYTRIYATASTLFSQGNRYLPKALLEEQEIDYDDIRDNLAQFRAGLNQRIARLATLLVPAVLPIFQRHSWLFSNYYIEGMTEKDQIYMYMPAAYYVFDYDSDGAGMLDCRRFYRGTKLTSSALLSILDDMLDPIIADEDFNIISGDIFKAYNGNVLKLGLVPDQLGISLQYNEEVLLQFKNAKCGHVKFHSSGPGFADGFFNIMQSTGKEYLEVLTPEDSFKQFMLFPQNSYAEPDPSDPNSQTRFAASMNEWTKTTMLTSPHSVVEPAENMVSTRLTLAVTGDRDTLELGYATNLKFFFGSEWPLDVQYVYYGMSRSSGIYTLYHHTFPHIVVVDVNGTNFNNVFEWLAMITKFKYAPELCIILDDGTVIHDIRGTFFDVDNYTYVDYNVIGRLHDTAIMGEYNVPKIAMFPTR